MNKNERLSIDLKINLDILEELYYSNITKRGLYKVYNQEIGSYYALKVYDVNMNDVQDIEKEIISNAMDDGLDEEQMINIFLAPTDDMDNLRRAYVIDNKRNGDDR